MDPQLRDLIQTSDFDLAAVQHVVERLPAEDSELDKIIEEAVAQLEEREFKYLSIATLLAGRPLDARHLDGGIGLIAKTGWLIDVALRMQGEIGQSLIDGLRAAMYPADVQAEALALAAVWCVEHRNGEFPYSLLPFARQLARLPLAGHHSFPFLLVTAVNTKDRNLQTLLRRQLPDTPDNEWKRLLEDCIPVTKRLLEIPNRPILDKIPVHFESELEKGGTIQRAISRVGRNEPCPCGSGRKYKNCCYADDQAKLHHSSDVSGVTREELDAAPEAHLTQAHLQEMFPHELARLDPTKIYRKMLPVYLNWLAVARMQVHAAHAFERIGYSKEFQNAWNKAVNVCAMERDTETLKRLIQVRRPHGYDEKDDPALRLLLMEDGKDYENYIAWLSEASIRAFEHGDPEMLERVVQWFAYSRYPGISMLVSWATLPFMPPERANSSFWDNLFRIRDHLNIAPDEPLIGVAKTVSGKTETVHEMRAAIEDARRQAEAARSKLRDIQESMKQLQRQTKREEAPATETAAVAPAPPSDGRIEKDLRKKIDFLTLEWKREHAEKNLFRRKSEAAEKAAEEMRAKLKLVESEQNELAADPEDDLILEEETGREQPVRLIDFPRDFSQRLEACPRHIARAAMSALGGIAAGEPDAFIGVKRLRIAPDVLRQRLGDYRLLFRIGREHVEVIDLVPRQDFERRIKTLSASAGS